MNIKIIKSAPIICKEMEYSEQIENYFTCMMNIFEEATFFVQDYFDEYFTTFMTEIIDINIDIPLETKF